MKVYFNENSYNTGNKTKQNACSGCIIGRGPHVKCPIDSKNGVYYLLIKFILIVLLIKYSNYEN